MTRQVSSERFFHINRQLPYATQPPLVVGQRLAIGAQENPFFRFFRTHVRQYPVNAADGTVSQVSAIAFLRHVRDGRIGPNNLPRDAFEIAEHFMLLARELLWETVRLADFPDAPSRQRGMWLMPDMQAVAEWIPRVDTPNQSNIQIVEFSATGRAHACDASFLLGDSELLDVSYDKARRYWAGEMQPQGSAPEILFEGDLEVVRIHPMPTP